MIMFVRVKLFNIYSIVSSWHHFYFHISNLILPIMEVSVILQTLWQKTLDLNGKCWRLSCKEWSLLSRVLDNNSHLSIQCYSYRFNRIHVFNVFGFAQIHINLSYLIFYERHILGPTMYQALCWEMGTQKYTRQIFMALIVY